jgi:serine/threonine protein kinase
VAIKKMQINKKNKEEYLAMEIGIMKTCQNPSIVRFIDSYRVDDIVWVRLTIQRSWFPAFLAPSLHCRI